MVVNNASVYKRNKLNELENRNLEENIIQHWFFKVKSYVGFVNTHFRMKRYKGTVHTVFITHIITPDLHTMQWYRCYACSYDSQTTLYHNAFWSSGVGLCREASGQKHKPKHIPSTVNALNLMVLLILRPEYSWRSIENANIFSNQFSTSDVI